MVVNSAGSLSAARATAKDEQRRKQETLLVAKGKRKCFMAGRGVILRDGIHIERRSPAPQSQRFESMGRTPLAHGGPVALASARRATGRLRYGRWDGFEPSGRVLSCDCEGGMGSARGIPREATPSRAPSARRVWMAYNRWWQSLKLPYQPATIHHPSGAECHRSATAL